MFTGVIETIGEVTDLQREGSNLHITIFSSLAAELSINQSIAHNGACLSVTHVEGQTHTVTAIDETLANTSLKELEVGSKLNLERAMPANGRFDGHIVQGHVDALGTCKQVEDQNGSWLYTFRYEPGKDRIIVDKGSITVDGTSLTIAETGKSDFSVAIIPYTHQHTIFHTYREGTQVNLEFDIIGKYVQRLVPSKDENQGKSNA